MADIKMFIEGNASVRLQGTSNYLSTVLWSRKNRGIRDKVRNTYRRTTRHFNSPPNPRISVRTSKGQTTVVAFMPDKVWNILDNGGGGTWRTVVTAKALRFNTSRKNKTRPGTLKTNSGGPIGPIVFAKATKPSRIQARKWTPLIGQEVVRYMQQTIGLDLRRGLRSV